MREKKRPEKILPVPELTHQITEIAVANGRAVQPFIRTFQYTGENITRQNLGTLIGVFTIDEMSEDCAYIVNFLASVAKKEYFSNSHRGPIESFESALHKINLALSELVKHGNVSWLGKLHGALAIIEKNNIHFSVTGQSVILLLRNSSVTDISIDLASPESPTHPIKTFVEVSSGRLNNDDRVLLASPELLALFSLEDLMKNARRMDHPRFTQFLKTALINELDMVGVILIEAGEVISAPTKTTKKPSDKQSQERIANIFSQTAFLPKVITPTASTEPTHQPSEPATSDTREEYIDTKTGHIYIQGPTHHPSAKHATLEQLILYTEALIERVGLLFVSQDKWIRKGKKYLTLATSLASDQLRSASQTTWRVIRRKWRHLRAHRGTPAVLPEPLPAVPPTPTPPRTVTAKISIPVSPSPLTQENTKTQPTDRANLATNSKTEAIIISLREHVRSWSKKSQTTFTYFTTGKAPRLTGATQKIMRRVTRIHTRIRTRLTVPRNIPLRITPTLSPPKHPLLLLEFLTKTLDHLMPRLTLRNHRLILGSMAVFLILLLVGLVLWLTSSSQPDTTNLLQNDLPSSQIAPPSTAENAGSATLTTTVLTNTTDPIIASVFLNQQAYVVTEKSIITLATGQIFPLPTGTTALFATVMDDLGLLFIYTKEKNLYAWSPVNTKLITNTLSLPDNTVVAGIDTYLTYLYVLDHQNNQIYRFPRAENGFGASTSWLRESVTIEETASFAVNDSLILATDPQTVKAYFRGRESRVFERSTDMTVTRLYTHSGLQNVYGLDPAHQRIIIWNQDGEILRNIVHETLSTGQTLAVNEQSNEIFVGTTTTLFSLPLQ